MTALLLLGAQRLFGSEEYISFSNNRWELLAFSGEPSRADPSCGSCPRGPQGSHCMEGSIRAKRAFFRVYVYPTFFFLTNGSDF